MVLVHHVFFQPFRPAEQNRRLLFGFPAAEAELPVAQKHDAEPRLGRHTCFSGSRQQPASAAMGVSQIQSESPTTAPQCPCSIGSISMDSSASAASLSTAAILSTHRLLFL